MTHTLAKWGLEVTVRRGWDARLVRRAATAPGETSHPLLHLASLRMPVTVKGDYGSHVVAHLRSGDAFVALKEMHPSLAHRGLYDHDLPWPLTPAMANPKGLQRVILGQSGIQHFFSHEGRAFALYVVLGSHAHRDSLVRSVNTTLAGVRIGARELSQTAHGPAR